MSRAVTTGSCGGDLAPAVIAWGKIPHSHLHAHLRYYCLGKKRFS